LTQIANQPHDLPVSEYHKHLSKFARNNALIVEDNLIVYLKFMDDLEVKVEDMIMKMCMQTLERDGGCTSLVQIPPCHFH
jgi:hypothetical protein